MRNGRLKKMPDPETKEEAGLNTWNERCTRKGPMHWPLVVSDSCPFLGCSSNHLLAPSPFNSLGSSVLRLMEQSGRASPFGRSISN